MFFSYVFMSFLFFSNFGKIFNKSNNYSVWNNNLINQNESSSNHQNLLCFYMCVVYFMGGIVFYFIKYFSKKYIELIYLVHY